MKIAAILNPRAWFSRSEATPSTTAPEAPANQPPRSGGGWSLLDLGAISTPLSVATVYRCVNILSDSVAMLPLRYMRMREGRFVPDTNGRLTYLLSVQPDATYNAFDFWRQVVQRTLLEGNAYIVPVYNPVSMEIDRLVLCETSAVAHDTVTDTYTISDMVNAVQGTYSEDEVIHIKGMSVDGKRGVSVLTYARLTTQVASTGDRETLNRFANGGNVRGLVSNDTTVRGFGEYQDEELKKTATDIDGEFQAGARIVSLPGQVDFKPISLSSTDMQFLESRKFTVREICRFFGVHPSYVFDDTSNNYKTAEMANVAFLNNTLNPILRRIEIELLRKLVAPSLAGKRKFEFDRQSLYACDLESRSRYWQQVIATGLYTVNELRREENKPDVEGGDIVLVSANLRAVTDVALGNQGAQIDESQSNHEEDGNDEGEE